MSEQTVQFEQPAAGIHVKQAVAIAVQTAKHRFSETPIRHVLHEELDCAEDADRWKVTVGYDRVRTEAESPPLIAATLRALSTSPLERSYKVVSIDAPTGKVNRVTMR